MLRDVRLRRAREQEAAAMNKLLNDNTTNPAAPDHAILLRETLDDVLARLGKQDRQIVLMRFFEGRNFAEIGACMSLTEDTAGKRVERALEKLRALYARRGVTSTAAALSALMAAEAAAAAPAGLAPAISGTILAGGGAVAATTATAAGILAFMTTTKIAIITTAVALLVGTLATVEARREKAAAAELGTLKSEHTALLKNLGDTQKYVKGYQTSLENFRRRKAEAAELGQNPHNPNTAGNAFLAEHPEIRAMLFEGQKAQIAERFYPLYKKLNLTPEQIAEFEDAYVKSTAYSATKNIPGMGLVVLTNSYAISSKEATDRFKEALGAKNVSKLSSYQTSSSIKELAYNLYYTDTPLTADQAERLGQVYLAARKDPRKNDLIEQSGAILSDPQMAMLKQMRADADWTRTVNQLIQAAAAKTAKQSNANTNTEKSQ